MNFDYDRQTKYAYNRAGIAKEYHASFNGPLTWRTLRFRCVAHRERKMVGNLLKTLKASSILDLPCGTGKLAPVFAQGAYTVHAADISADMMDLAKQSYAAALLTRASFSLCDAEHITQQFGVGNMDVVVCLRLMHRVPADTRTAILRQLSLAARHVIISYAVDSRFHRFRRLLRNLLFGVTQQNICASSLQDIQRELWPQFKVLKSSWVAYFLSEEIVFLLESKSHHKTPGIAGI